MGLWQAHYTWYLSCARTSEEICLAHADYHGPRTAWRWTRKGSREAWLTNVELITSYCDGNVRAVDENGPLPSVEAVDSLAWFSAWSSALSSTLSSASSSALRSSFFNLKTRFFNPKIRISVPNTRFFNPKTGNYSPKNRIYYPKTRVLIDKQTNIGPQIEPFNSKIKFFNPKLRFFIAFSIIKTAVCS